jgi:hypothetical protein
MCPILQEPLSANLQFLQIMERDNANMPAASLHAFRIAKEGRNEKKMDSH